MEVINVDSWGRLAEVIEATERDTTATWLFRGVTDHKHTLIPKIGRPGARKDPSNGDVLPHLEEAEKRTLELFQRTAKPYLRYEPKTSLEWLAMAQHHGSPTRLLDWTASPLIAAYFAMEKAGTEGSPGIYVLNAPPKASAEEEMDPFGMAEVRSYFPPHISPRIQVQRSMFTVHPCPSCEFNPEGLRKWVFPKGRPCFDIKLVIDRMGFNRGALFPDLQGLAEHVGWCYKWGVLYSERPNMALQQTKCRGSVFVESNSVQAAFGH